MAHGYPPFRIEIVRDDSGYRYRFWDSDIVSYDLSRDFATEAECLAAADRRRDALVGTANAGGGDSRLRIEIVAVDGGYRFRLWDGDNLSHGPSQVFATEGECLTAADLRRAALQGTSSHAAFDAPRFRIEIIKVDGAFRYRLWDEADLALEPSRLFGTEAECLSAARERAASLDGAATYGGDDEPAFQIEIITVDGGFRYRLWDEDDLPHGPSRVFPTEAECRSAARERRAAIQDAAASAGDGD